MGNHIGLENILRAELTLLSKQILQDIHQQDIKELHRSVRKLYEKMAAIKVLSEQLTEEEIVKIIHSKDTEKSIEKVTKTPIETVQSKEEPKVSEEVVLKPKETPKTERQKVDDIFKEVANISFVKKEKPSDAVQDVLQNDSMKDLFKQSKISKKQVIDKTKDISIGINDRIAFVSNLFKGDTNAYNETISKLNTCSSYESALQVIYNEVKPKYNNWEGKDQYEFRLLQLLELKYN